MSNTSKAFSLSDISVEDLLDSNTDLSPDTTENADAQDPTEGSTDGTPDADQDGSDPSDTTPPDDNDDSPDTDEGDQDDDPDTDEEGSEEVDGEGEGDDPQESVIAEVSELLGFEVEGEFSEDVSGIAEYTKKVGEKMGEQYLANILEQFPDVHEFLNYRAQGGTTEDFFKISRQEMDYSSITEDQLKGSADLQKQVVREMYSKMGFEPDEIEDTLKDLEDSELLEKQAIKSSSKLKQFSAAEKAALIERQKEAAKQQEIADQETWREISTTIGTGSLKGMTVPESDKQSFFDWMSKPIDNKGTTQRMVDMSNIDTESSLALEYMYYKKFNVASAPNRKSSKESTLRSRLRKNTGSVQGVMNKGKTGGHQRTTKLPGLNDIF